MKNMKNREKESNMPIEKIFVFGGLFIATLFVVAGWMIEISKTPEERGIDACGNVCSWEGMGTYTIHPDGTSTCICSE